MKVTFALAVATTALSMPVAAQQAAPRFAPPNLAPEGVRALASNCAPCHGPEGRPAKGSDAAALAGRAASDLERALGAFKRGDQAGTVMPQLARGYGDDEIAALARYFSRLAP